MFLNGFMSTMILEFLLLLLVAILISAFLLLPYPFINLRPKTIWKMSKLPGPKGLPFFIGLAFRIAALRNIDILPYFFAIRRDYPRIAAYWVAGIPVVWLFEPEDIETILASVQQIQKGIEYSFFVPWLQDGLLLSKGEKWHRRRKLLTPAFHFKILENNLPSINKNARHLLRNMLKTDGKPFNAGEYIVPCTLDILCETAMGHSLNLQENEGNIEYLNAVKRACTLIFDRCTKVPYVNEWLYALTKYSKQFHKNLNYLHNFTENVVQNRKLDYLSKKEDFEEKCEENDVEHFGKIKKAFLDILIEIGGKSENTISDKDINEEIHSFMFAGHDTTSSCLTFTIYLLGKHPQVQEKAYEELYEIFGDSDRSVTNKDLHEMHYLEMIIKESLRLYPSVPYITRLLTQDLVLKDNVVIPEGADVGILPFLIHRDPKYYPNPEVFDPERFSLENCKNRHPYAYIPFSAGPRNCIGQKFAMMELKIVLSTIIRFAKIESVNEINYTNLIPVAILRTVDPIQIKLISRC